MRLRWVVLLLIGAASCDAPASSACTYDTDCPLFTRCLMRQCVGADAGVYVGASFEGPDAPRYVRLVDLGVPDAHDAGPDANPDDAASMGGDH